MTAPWPKRIYLSPPHMAGPELEYLKEAYQSNWIAPLGPFVDRLESDFAAYMQGGYATAVSSGTAALHLLLRILGAGPGDRVFCSTLTFCASANPVIYQGAEPVFIDSDSSSWNMDPQLLEEALKQAGRENRLPKAVIAVHLYGQSSDMDAIMAVCKPYGIPVIEDAAEALGAQYKGRPAGTTGWASVFSFNGNKMITTSGGGMIWSNDEKLIQRARFLSTQARDPAPHYEHSEIGYNYRMSNLLAAVGVGQMEVLDQRVRQARAVYEYYVQRLGAVPGISFMPEPVWSFHSRWLTCITLDAGRFGTDPEAVRNHLENHHVESRPLWKPMHMQPVFRNCPIFGGNVSGTLFERGLCLPSGTAMTKKELDYVCTLIESLSPE